MRALIHESSHCREARHDLFGIWDYLADTSERTANECIDRITAKLNPLMDFPQLGVDRSDIAPAVRILVIERWIALYRIEADAIRIIRIVDGARELSSLIIPDE